MKSQKEKIIEQLKLNGYVSRNWCLQNFISRLGALIYILKNEGWEFDEKKTGYYSYENEKDYLYYINKLNQNDK